MSARLPLLRLPMDRSSPRARAPFSVAISSAACDGRAVGSPLEPLARSAVSAQADVDTEGVHAGNRRNSARELEIGGGTVRDVAAVFGEERNFVLGEVHRMHRDESGAEQAQSL